MEYEYEKRNDHSDKRTLAYRMSEAYLMDSKWKPTNICVQKMEIALTAFEKELELSGSVKLPSGRVLSLGGEVPMPDRVID